MKLKRIALAVAVATTIVGPLAASASEWWGDDPYWQAQLGQPASAAARPAARSGGTDLFGRPIVRLEGTEGYTQFEPLPEFWAKRQPEQPVAYAAQGTTARDVSGIDEAPERRSGAAIVERNNAERARLQQSGFPQYNY